jgi:hypothetical protein
MHAAALTFLAVSVAAAQGVSPDGPQQAARFDAVTHTVTKAGYTAPHVIGSTSDTTGAVFIVLAARGGKGSLLAVVEPDGTPVEIETGENPAAMGVSGVHFEPFLGAVGVMDVVVGHKLHQLETSSTFERHHILRRRGKVLTGACNFDGSSTSSTAKGPRSVTSTRTVSIEKVMTQGGPFLFDVKSVEETSERTDSGPSTSLGRHDSAKRYDLPMSGMCKAQ